MFERLISSAKLGIIFDTAKLLQKFLYLRLLLGHQPLVVFLR